jgi:hypothetical protein
MVKVNVNVSRLGFCYIITVNAWNDQTTHHEDLEAIHVEHPIIDITKNLINISANVVCVFLNYFPIGNNGLQRKSNKENTKMVRLK